MPKNNLQLHDLAIQIGSTQFVTKSARKDLGRILLDVDLRNNPIWIKSNNENVTISSKAQQHLDKFIKKFK